MFTETQSELIGSINKLTKKVIENSDSFHSYYIDQKTNYYEDTLPLVLHEKKLQNSYNKSEKRLINLSKKYPLSLKSIRHVNIRSKKIPELCPIFNKRGELLPSVVKNSKICKKSNYSYERNKSQVNLGIYPMKMRNLSTLQINNISSSFNNFKNDFFSDEYLKLHYNEEVIFNQHEKYYNIIKERIEYFKTNSNKNNTTYLEKIYNFGLENKKIRLLLMSMKINFEDPNEELEPFNNMNINKNLQIEIPFALLPLFYYKGIESFKKILCSIIKFTNNYEKVSINEDSIYNTLKNLKDFTTDESEIRKESNLSQLDKSTIKINQINDSTNKKIPVLCLDNDNLNDEYENLKAEFPKYQNSVPNLREKLKFEIYYTENQNSYNNISKYNLYSFLWTTNSKTFKVTITLPLITFTVPSNSIKVQQFLDYELLFYIYNLNFIFWDYYIMKYLSRFKQFRFLLEKLISHSPIHNLNIFLMKPKLHKYSFNDEQYIFIHTNKKNKNQLITLKSFYLIITIFDNENLLENEYKIFFNFKHLIKIIQIGKCTSKILFLIKFMDFNNDNTVTFNFKNLEHFDVLSWLNNIQKYNSNYFSNTLHSRIEKLIREFDSSLQKKVRIEFKKPLLKIGQFDKFLLIENKHILLDEIMNELVNKLNFFDWSILIKNSLNKFKEINIISIRPNISSKSVIPKKHSSKGLIKKKNGEQEEKNSISSFNKKLKEKKTYIFKAFKLNKFFEFKEENKNEYKITLKKKEKIEKSNNNNIFDFFKEKKINQIDNIDLPLPIINKIKIIIKDNKPC